MGGDSGRSDGCGGSGGSGGCSTSGVSGGFGGSGVSDGLGGSDDSGDSFGSFHFVPVSDDSGEFGGFDFGFGAGAFGLGGCFVGYFGGLHGVFQILGV